MASPLSLAGDGDDRRKQMTLAIFHRLEERNDALDHRNGNKKIKLHFDGKRLNATENGRYAGGGMV